MASIDSCFFLDNVVKYYFNIELAERGDQRHHDISIFIRTFAFYLKEHSQYGYDCEVRLCYLRGCMSPMYKDDKPEVFDSPTLFGDDRFYIILHELHIMQWHTYAQQIVLAKTIDTLMMELNQEIDR